MRPLSKKFLACAALLVFILALGVPLAAPLPALAQNSGYGCIVGRADLPESVNCSTRTDCSDLINPRGELICRNVGCQILEQCGQPAPPDGEPTGGGSAGIPSLPINPSLPIPNAIPISGEDGQGPAALVANMYSFAFLLAGILAFAMIVYGGVRWTFSGGSASAKKDAKDAITQALLGLALLLLAYLILRTINPDLTRLRLPTLPEHVPFTEPAAVAPPPDSEAPGERDINPPPTDDPNCSVRIPPVAGDALGFEGGDTVSYTSSDPNIQRNLDFLQLQLNRARNALSEAGASSKVNSAYRPLSYQQHLYQVWSNYKAFQQIPVAAAACPKLKAWVDAEMKKHILIRDDGTISSVSRPTICSTHVRGVAADITFTGITHAEADALFKEKGVELRWKRITGDEAHYELCARPYTPSGCPNNLPSSC
jgi:hypothetical protein